MTKQGGEDVKVRMLQGRDAVIPGDEEPTHLPRGKDVTVPRHLAESLIRNGWAREIKAAKRQKGA